MYKTREENESLVQQKVVLLEWSLSRSIRHGESVRCPWCGKNGCFDLNGPGFLRDRNSVYFSTVFHERRCRFCNYLVCA